MPRRKRQGANLYLRGATWWCWYYDAAGNQVRRSTHQVSRPLAEKVAGQLEREAIEAGEKPAPLGLKGAFAAWLVYLESHERADDTLDYYALRVRSLLRELGEDTDAHELTLTRMDAYVAARRATQFTEGKTVSRATIAKELGALKSCLRYHQKRGTYRGEPASVIPDMRGAYVPRDRALSIDEFGALLKALSPDRRDYLVGYVGLGASQSELYRITAADVRADTVRVPGTKRESRDRWVPLRPEVRAVLKRRAKDAPEGPLFEPWGNARRDLSQACERAGIPPVSHNDLRRTFATWLGEAGVPEGVVASLMGHTSSAMVRRVYTKIGREAQKEAVAKLPKLGGHR